MVYLETVSQPERLVREGQACAGAVGEANDFRL